MAVFSKLALSGSTNGRMVKIAATAASGTLLHTAHATALDEIWLWAINTDTTDRKLTLEFGGVASPDDEIELTVPAESGLILILPGLILTNSLVTRAFAATANVILIGGYVNRIT